MAAIERIGIAIREFARREGVSDTLVHQALRHGRLTANADRSIDPKLVGTPWRKRNLDAPEKPAKATSAPTPREASSEAALPSTGSLKGLSYSEAMRVKENYLAMLRKLEYEEKSGSLIDVAIAESVLFECFRSQRDAWLSWPTKIAPLIATDLGLDNTDRLTELLTAEVFRQIEDLGEAPEQAFSRAA